MDNLPTTLHNDPYNLSVAQSRISFAPTELVDEPPPSDRLVQALRHHEGPMDLAGIDALQAIVEEENPALQAALNENIDTPPPSPPASIPATDAPSK